MPTEPLSAPRTTLERLAARHDLSLRLTSDEVAELTERVLEASDLGADETAQQVPLRSCLRVLEANEVSEPVLAQAIEGLLRSREQRLSSVIARKAHELERMLFTLLPRLDATYDAEVSVPVPRHPSERGRAGVVLEAVIHCAVRSQRGLLEVRVSYTPASALRERLFTIVVRGPRRPARWLRSFGRQRLQPRSVEVRSPLFKGSTVEDLLSWTLKRKAVSAADGSAAAFAVESLGAIVMGEAEKAMRYMHELEFETSTS